jgi:RNA polymerase sigma-70 factor, ECF subfamily
MTNVSDVHIFKLIQQGDVVAFNGLFDKYYTPLCHFACRYLSDMDTSRSIVQEVFIDLWVKRGKLTVGYSIKSYLYHSVKNRTIDYMRKHKENVGLSSSIEELRQSQQRDLIHEAELSARISQAINQLPDKCREIFLLCKFDGMKYNQIAQKLGISVKTVEMQMGIALKKLRNSLYDLRMINLFSLFLKRTAV